MDSEKIKTSITAIRKIIEGCAPGTLDESSKIEIQQLAANIILFGENDGFIAEKVQDLQLREGEYHTLKKNKRQGEEAVSFLRCEIFSLLDCIEAWGGCFDLTDGKLGRQSND